MKSNKVSFCKDSYKYFIGYRDDYYNIILKMTKMTRYEKILMKLNKFVY